MTRLESWLRSVLWESTLPIVTDKKTTLGPDFSVHRTKGRIITKEFATKMIQGVREVFEIVDLETPKPSFSHQSDPTSMQSGKLVLIGRGIHYELFQRSLDDSLSR